MNKKKGKKGKKSKTEQKILAPLLLIPVFLICCKLPEKIATQYQGEKIKRKTTIKQLRKIHDYD